MADNEVNQSEAPQPNRKPQNKGVRIAAAGADHQRPFYAAGAAALAFLAALIISGLYMGGKISTLEQAAQANVASVSACRQQTAACVEELARCVEDVNSATTPTTPAGLVPRDFRAEKKRKKMTALAGEFEQKKNRLFSRIRAVNNPKRLSKGAWRDIKADSAELEKIAKQTDEAEQAYNAVLRETLKPPSGATDPALIDRNVQRAKRIQELHNHLK